MLFVLGSFEMTAFDSDVPFPFTVGALLLFLISFLSFLAFAFPTMSKESCLRSGVFATLFLDENLGYDRIW